MYGIVDICDFLKIFLFWLPWFSNYKNDISVFNAICFTIIIRVKMAIKNMGVIPEDE